MAAMQMDFTLPPAPEPGALPLATVSVEVMPTEGITYFFLAVLASLLLTALVFHMHKTVCLPPQHPCARPPREATRAGQGKRKAAVRPGTEAAAPPIPSVALRHRSGERFGIVVSLSLIFAFCATLGACFLPVFRLSKGGLLGVALGGESSDEYSVIESGVQLRHASPSSPDWLMEGYRVIYFLVIMVAPLAWYFGCLLAWFVPLSPSSRHAAGFMLNVCSSLGALEVYVVCMILSIVQLDAIAQQIVGEISHGLCDTVGAVAEAPLLSWSIRPHASPSPPASDPPTFFSLLPPSSVFRLAWPSLRDWMSRRSRCRRWRGAHLTTAAPRIRPPRGSHPQARHATARAREARISLRPILCSGRVEQRSEGTRVTARCR
ncbi:hypothetical protein EMIHUDRAFT_433872 [Emiliania huxleyi CCMP1516]|uniref:Uncharacterized protein n=2 Tax=Emiliania huxleyi TaxID=2903 RepID=A0A0D3KIF4_EMIH1|nr:hypothetical protein EMIHUDRAFT_433872 [Emiliania huxleyi CCMP1516]EOD35539.1 hypothetical protein EMIHUDRAFT_433872 [Emiliania huxleyi CCMP1516]|eukprot:XP_005787968.1 hypothetical protein EMIHUDRAFT_433872 [Emiliania huxleyi CCMP1516]